MLLCCKCTASCYCVTEIQCTKPVCLEYRNTPGTLKALTAALFAAGPALVYFVPDNSTPLVVAQVLGALLCVVGGSAAWGGATLIGALQKD